jgi:hypothetical protein
MNLMVSLAVGDVNELRMSAEERLLKIKVRHLRHFQSPLPFLIFQVNFCIEALHLSEQISFLGGLGIDVLHRTATNNVLVVYKSEEVIFSRHFGSISSSKNLHLTCGVWTLLKTFLFCQKRAILKANKISKQAKGVVREVMSLRWKWVTVDCDCAKSS